MRMRVLLVWCFKLSHYASGWGSPQPQADKSKIVEMFSQQGEKVEMEHPVEARGNAL